MQKPNLFIFDCDGVLANCGAVVTEQEVFDRFVGRSLGDVAESLQISPSSAAFDSLNNAYHTSVLAALESELEAMPGPMN
ncbi:MAG: hypothetical protein P8P70_02190 [Sulfitobacter sp.]|nr:hypothetical protein [Sulfitobacter sp.]